MKLNSMEDLLIHELRDLLSAEKQLRKALPKWVASAYSIHLADVLEMHLEETAVHAERLEHILRRLGVSPKGEKCAAMEGLLEEATLILGAEGDDQVRDAALIAAAQRVEHYEIAGYGCARTFANLLGLHDAAELLQQTLDEEKNADEQLTELATAELNVRATE